MTNPMCPVCGHVNLLSATVCEMCDARLGGPGAPEEAAFRGAAGETEGGAGGEPGADAEGFDPYAAGAGWGAGAIPSPRFKGVGDVMVPTLRVYGRHFVLVGILVAVTTLPVALAQYAFMKAIMAATSDPASFGAGRAFAFTVAPPLILGLLSFVGAGLLSGALVYAVVDIERAGAASAGECLRRGLRVLPKVLLVTFLYALITGVGFLLLIAPGIIFTLMYAVAVPVAVLEGPGAFESLKRSARLTEGYRGLIFQTYFLWWLATMAVNMVVSGSFAAAGQSDMLPALVVVSLVGGMLNSSATVLTVYVYLGILNERGLGFEAP
ncbi:MAG TPA: YciC family protein [Pyrinomonadaceae bacterium]|jgi:hypothetical protein